MEHCVWPEPKEKILQLDSTILEQTSCNYVQPGISSIWPRCSLGNINLQLASWQMFVPRHESFLLVLLGLKIRRFIAIWALLACI